MKKYLAKTPVVVQRMYPKRLWTLADDSNPLYLTFDDGPIPEVTPWVLDMLRDFNAKATFFCIGENVCKQPELFKRIVKEGHSIGNHTYSHLKGWKSNATDYLSNVKNSAESMRRILPQYSGELLFRPPYGKITVEQAGLLQKEGYKIVMWDVLSFDWDSGISGDRCFKNVSENMANGSIVVFHDSLKAEKNLRYVLPKVLELAVARKYSLKAL